MQGVWAFGAAIGCTLFALTSCAISDGGDARYEKSASSRSRGEAGTLNVGGRDSAGAAGVGAHGRAVAAQPKTRPNAMLLETPPKRLYRRPRFNDKGVIEIVVKSFDTNELGDPDTLSSPGVPSGATQRISHARNDNELDINEDERPDFAITVPDDHNPHDRQGQLLVFLSKADPRLKNGVQGGSTLVLTTRPNPTDVALGDVTGDGKPDLVVVSAGIVPRQLDNSPNTFKGFVEVFINTGRAGLDRFEKKGGFELDFEPAGVALGNIDAEDNGGGAGGTDADADANTKATLDLAIAGHEGLAANEQGILRVYRNLKLNEGGGWRGFEKTNPENYQLGQTSDPRGLAFVQLDGQNGDDIAVALFGTGKVAMFRSEEITVPPPTARFDRVATVDVGVGVTDIVARDIGEENDIDLLATNARDETVTFLFNSGNGDLDTRFGTQPTLGVGKIAGNRAIFKVHNSRLKPSSTELGSDHP